MPTQTFSLPESTNRTQSHTITITNLKSINSTSVNTGSVSVSSVNGNNVTISVSGGSYSRRVQTGGSYIPSDSKTVSETITRNNTSFPSSTSYSSGGYSGTLYPIGNPSSEVISGTYTPSDSKTVTDSRSSSSNSFPASIAYESGGYSGSLSKSGSVSSEVISGTYTPSDSKTAEQTITYTSTSSWLWNKMSNSWVNVGSNIASATASYSYSSGGYSGTLTRSSDSESGDVYFYITDGPQHQGTEGSQITYTHYLYRTYSGTVTKPASDTRVWEYTQAYSGTVTKPASDTRVWEYTQAYSGTVTKPASDTRTYTYYYEYIVTVDYIGNSAPTVTIKTIDNIVLTQNSFISSYEKVSFPFVITANDVDTGDSLRYSVRLNNVIRTSLTSISKGSNLTYTIPFSEMQQGNNVIMVNVQDNNGASVSRTFTLKNITPNSYCQREVHSLMTVLGYSVEGSSSLQSLKPSGYSKTTISLAELVNYLT